MTYSSSLNPGHIFLTSVQLPSRKQYIVMKILPEKCPEIQNFAALKIAYFPELNSVTYEESDIAGLALESVSQKVPMVH